MLPCAVLAALLAATPASALRVGRSAEGAADAPGAAPGTIVLGSRPGCGTVTIPANGLESPGLTLSDADRCSIFCQLAGIPLGEDATKHLQSVHHKTCAVVSSSGALLQHRLGREIDGKHAVLRFGTAPATGRYMRSAGSKETYRFLNSELQTWPPRHLNLGVIDSGMLFITDAVLAQPGITSLAAVQSGLKALLQDVFPHFNYSQGHEVSAGMTGTTFMLHMCDDLFLYEMIPSPHSKGPWHYWERFGTASHNWWHNSLSFEQTLWSLLAMADSNVAKGVAHLEGFRKMARTCDLRLAPVTPAVAKQAPAPVARPACDTVPLTMDDAGEVQGALTREQREALYCQLRHHAPLGAAAQQLAGVSQLRTCAVVSASYDGSSHSEIDGADAVMRFNQAVPWLHNRMGSKETFRLLSAKLLEKPLPELSLGKISSGIFLLTDGPGQEEKPGIVPLGPVRLAVRQILDGAFPGLPYFTEGEVSSEMAGLVFMLNACDQVTLYGLVAPRGRSWYYLQRWYGTLTAPGHTLLPHEYAFWKALAGPGNFSGQGYIRLRGIRQQAQ